MYFLICIVPHLKVRTLGKLQSHGNKLCNIEIVPENVNVPLAIFALMVNNVAAHVIV